MNYVRKLPEKIRLNRILVTNGDGVDAAGLALLAELAAEIADEVWVVAPHENQSGSGVGLSINQPLRVMNRGPRRFAVSGKPSDCVALALGHLMRDAPPQLLLSGINAGANLGDESNISGTIGAALTGLMLGVPAIAISQACRDANDVRWETARAHLPALIQHFLGNGWRRETCLSINLPDAHPAHIQDMVWTRQTSRVLAGIQVEARHDLRGNDYFWLGLDHQADAAHDEDADYAALKHNQISVSCLALDRSLAAGRPALALRSMAES